MLNCLCTSCKNYNGLAFFHVYYVQTMYANQVGYIIVRARLPGIYGLKPPESEAIARGQGMVFNVRVQWLEVLSLLLSNFL